MSVREWWRDAVIYQVYIRSFADGSGDGVGDIAGIRARVPYLAELGVDALWINPWYPSPQADGGYDVADYRAIDPAFGSVADAEALIAEAHRRDMKIILDIVPNHTSSDHPWFKAALEAPPGSPERARYIFRPGRGTSGELPPTNWRSSFGGSAWRRVADGEWYLHLFAPEQPDLNWQNPEVRAEFEAILRFWFDRGVDGFRIDVAHGLAKDPAFPDLPPNWKPRVAPPLQARHPAWDQDGVHDIYRDWRRVADSYDNPPRAYVGEAWVMPDRLSRYVRPDELHTAFNFDFVLAGWNTEEMRRAIDDTITTLSAVGAPNTWVLSNHDVVRHVTRFGRPAGRENDPAGTVSTDVELGTRRARAAALLMFALPGGAYIYQGEELGLWEVEDLPVEVLQDPVWERSGHKRRGRDGCRVPIPWSGDEPPFGFGDRSWLPQPEAWKSFTVERETGDPASMLTLYREAVRIRRSHPALGDGGLQWIDAPEDVLAFTRQPGFCCVVNFSGRSVPLPAHEEVLLASGPVDDELPTDCAAWLRISG